jgi:hypothetical protein
VQSIHHSTYIYNSYSDIRDIRWYSFQIVFSLVKMQHTNPQRREFPAVFTLIDVDGNREPEGSTETNRKVAEEGHEENRDRINGAGKKLMVG